MASSKSKSKEEKLDPNTGQGQEKEEKGASESPQSSVEEEVVEKPKTDSTEESKLAKKPKKKESKEAPIPLSESLFKQGAGMESQLEKASHLTIQMIVFKLGNEEYAVPIEVVKEVVLTPEIASMPETPEHVLGVGNIRGNIIAIIDLVNRFEIKSKAIAVTTSDDEGDEVDEKKNEELISYTLVVEADGFTSGILLDNVPDSLAITEEHIDRNPGIILNSGSGVNYVKGIIKIDDRLIILIDIVTILNEEMDNVVSEVA